MELEILDKVRKDKEEKEAQESRVPPMITYPDGKRGKNPMQDPP